MTAPSDAPIVSTSELHRQYGEGEAAVHALRGVSLAFPPGEFTAIMGPSGSGKSTLMHLLAGLDRPTSGSVVVAGQELANLDDKTLASLRRDKVGFVFQAFNLIPVLTALENVELPLLLAGTDAKAARQAARETLERVGLGHRLTHRPSQLSGGEQQRAAVARALAADPLVVLADEPSGNLDSANSERLHQLFAHLSREFETALVVVTHNRSLAGRADRVLSLEDGRLVPLSGVEAMP